MGLFSSIRDSGIAVDLQNMARDMNRYQRSLISILEKMENSRPSEYDKTQALGYIQSIENKALEMQARMNDLSPERLFTTMVPCLDGHMTAVPGFVMSAMQMSQMIRAEIKKI